MTRIELPNRFWDDYADRFRDQVAADAVVIKRLSRTTRLDVGPDLLFDLLEDAEFYADTQGLDVEAVGLGLVNSARAAAKRLRAVIVDPATVID